MPSAFVPPPTLHIPQPINDGTNLPFTLQKNQYKQDPESVQPVPGPSNLIPSSFHSQAQCLHAIQETIQQLQQRLKAEQLEWDTLQFIAHQFQNDFALLRYFLFFSVGNISKDDDSVSRATFQPTNKPNPNPVLVEILHTSVDEPSIFRFTPEGAVGPARIKITNFANTSLQSSLSTWESPATTMQHLISRISKLSKKFAAEIATYTSINAGILFRVFSYMIQSAN